MANLISRLFSLYKMQTTNREEDAKEYSKHLPREEAKKLRIKNKYVFKVISFFARWWISKQVIDKGQPIPENLYNENFILLDQQTYLDMIYKNVVDIRDNWNVLIKVDKEDTNDIFIAVDKHTNLSTQYKDNRYGDLEDSLQWQCYLATAIYRLLPLFKGKQFNELEDFYHNLLNGIERCFIGNNILRHPLKSVQYDLEPISTDMISGLLLLCAVTKDEILTKLIVNVFKENDYFIPETSTDLSPSLIWNPIRAMSYAGIKLLDNSLSDNDKEKVLDMMSIMPYDKTPANGRSIYGAVTATNLCEVLAYLDEDFRIPAIEFTEYQYLSSNEMNPEFAGVLASLFHLIGYKTKMENYTDITLRWSSQFLGLNRTSNTNLENYNRCYPLPLKYRSANDYFWQRTAYNNWLDLSRNHPNVDFLTIISKSLPFTYYPSEK